MLEKPSNQSSPNPEEDPNSELNVLRREVRQLQAAVRDAALQAAVAEEESTSLRTALVSAEQEIDEGLSREAQLRAQLDAQRVKRQTLESTLAAAEALVKALRDVAVESLNDGDVVGQSKDEVDIEEEIDDEDVEDDGAAGTLRRRINVMNVLHVGNGSTNQQQLHGQQDLDVLLSRLDTQKPHQKKTRQSNVIDYIGTSSVSTPTPASTPTPDSVHHHEHDVYTTNPQNVNVVTNATTIVDDGQQLRRVQEARRRRIMAAVQTERRPQSTPLPASFSTITSATTPSIASTDPIVQLDDQEHLDNLDDVRNVDNTSNTGDTVERKDEQQQKPDDDFKVETVTQIEMPSAHHDEKEKENIVLPRRESTPIIPSRSRPPASSTSSSNPTTNTSTIKQSLPVTVTLSSSGGGITRRHSVPIHRDQKDSVLSQNNKSNDNSGRPLSLSSSSSPTPSPSSSSSLGLLRSAFGTSSLSSPTSITTPSPSSMTTCTLKLRNSIHDAHSGEIFSVASSMNGCWIASGADDKTIRVYDATGNSVGVITDMPKTPTALALTSPLSTSTSSTSLRSSLNPTSSIPIVYAGGSDGAIRMFKRAAGRRTKLKWSMHSVFPVHTQGIRRMIMLPQNQLILSCSTDRWLKLSDIDNLKRPFATVSPSAVLDIDLLSTTTTTTELLETSSFVSAHKDGGIRIWSIRDQNPCVASMKVHNKAVISVRSIHGTYNIVSLGRDNMVRVSDLRMDGIKPLRELDGGMVETLSDWHRLAVHPTDSRFIVAGSNHYANSNMKNANPTLRFWNSDTGKIIKQEKQKIRQSNYDDNVLGLVSRNLRDPGGVVVPHWTTSGLLVCAHRSRQVSFWDM